MIKNTIFTQILFLSISSSFLSCEKEISHTEKNVKPSEQSEPSKNYSYSEDIKSEYKYSVSGIDYDNNKVYGEIDLDGQNGVGTLIRNEDTTVEIVVENISHGKLIAIDIDGNQYHLKLD